MVAKLIVGAIIVAVIVAYIVARVRIDNLSSHVHQPRRRRPF